MQPIFAGLCVTGRGCMVCVCSPLFEECCPHTGISPSDSTDQSEASIVTWWPIRGQQCQSRMPGYQASLCSAQRRQTGKLVFKDNKKYLSPWRILAVYLYTTNLKMSLILFNFTHSYSFRLKVLIYIPSIIKSYQWNSLKVLRVLLFRGCFCMIARDDCQ